MKIEDKADEVFVPFPSIAVGDVFERKLCKNLYYLRIYNTKDGVTAVNLHNTELCKIQDHERVRIVDAVLKINN